VAYSDPPTDAPTTISTIAATSTPSNAALTTSVAGTASMPRPCVTGRLTTRSSATSADAATATTVSHGSDRTVLNLVHSARIMPLLP
jgi:hypothetical protein